LSELRRLAVEGLADSLEENLVNIRMEENGNKNLHG
jgi:hypothetical protein